MVRNRKWLLRSGMLSLVAGAALVVGAACAADTTTTTDSGNRTLEQIAAEGRLVCGVQSATPGFGTADRVGHDVDYCRAIAAAIFGSAVDTGSNPNLVYVNASGSDRFELLAQGSGESGIDVLVRTTTWTSGRDSNLGAQFTATTFFDQFGLMVRADLAARINSAEDLNGLTACARPGTSTLDGLQDLAAQVGISFNAATPEGDATVVVLYQEEQCDILASDTSQLAGFRSEFTGELANSVILGGAQLTTLDGRTIQTAKEPLGPSVHANSGPDLFDLVQWVNFGLITAEEQGITQANVDTRASAGATGNTPVAQRVLGLSDNGFDSNIVPHVANGREFIRDAIRAVGNYGEIYDRHLEALVPRACSPQQLWNVPRSAWADCNGDGTATFEESRGLIYAPRFSG